MSPHLAVGWTALYSLVVFVGHKPRQTRRGWVSVLLESHPADVKVLARARCSFGDHCPLPSSRVIGRTHFLRVIEPRTLFLAGCQPGHSQLLEVTHFSCLVAPSLSKASNGDSSLKPHLPLMLILTPLWRLDSGLKGLIDLIRPTRMMSLS